MLDNNCGTITVCNKLEVYSGRNCRRMKLSKLKMTEHKHWYDLWTGAPDCSFVNLSQSSTGNMSGPLGGQVVVKHFGSHTSRLR